MDKSLDELITQNRRRGARGGDDGTGYQQQRGQRSEPYNRRNRNNHRNREDLRATLGNEAPVAVERKKRQPRQPGFGVAVTNLHYNVMADDLREFVGIHLPHAKVLEVTLDFDKSGRSTGASNVRFESQADAVHARNVLHGLALKDQLVNVVLATDSEDVVDLGGVVDEDGKYLYKSILDRLGSNRPAPVTEVRRNAAVLDRLGSRILDRLGPQSLYASRGSSRPESRRRPQHNSRKPVRPEDLDAEMDRYMTSEGKEVDNGGQMDLGDDDSNDREVEDRYSRPERKEFVDFDAPSADPYTAAGGGGRANREVLDYELAAAQCVMRNALHVVINHVDAKGWVLGWFLTAKLNTPFRRFVAELFMALVDRKLYPDYYRVITRPIAIETMLERIETNVYAQLGAAQGLLAFEGDFQQLANNAMTYNQVGSDVFKDARTLLTLFQHELAKETRLAEADPQAVKYKTIVNNIMAYQDHTDRYVWDVFFELPDKKLYKDYYFSIKNPIALDVIITKIDSLQYKSNEQFAADIQLMIRNAKTYNVEGSQIYKDAQLLDAYFRDQFAKFVVNSGVDSVGTGGSAAGTPPVTGTPVGPRTTTGPVIVEGEPLESITVQSEVYKAGDYVYISNPIDPSKPTIGQIQSTYKSSLTGNPSFTAAWFLRPHQTFQLASAKFMENEVLKTNRLESYDSQEIVGRCWVLNVKDYLRGKPKGCNDMKDVFACESRYTIEGKSTSKIKLWQNKFADPELEVYDAPLVPVRVPMFKEEGGGVDYSKKRRSEDYGDSSKDDLDFQHQDKKIKVTLSGRQSIAPSLSTPTASSREHRDRTKPSGGTIPSLSQQVASLVLPGTKAAATAAGLSGNSTNNSNAGSGTATPNHPGPGSLTNAGGGGAGGAGGLSATAAAAAAATAEAGVLGPILELFDRTPAGEVKWYAGLPVDVVKRETVTHSLQYRVAKMKEKKAAAAAAAAGSGVGANGVNGGSGSGDGMDVDVNGAVDGVVANGVGGRVDLEEQLWRPMKQAFYDLAKSYLA
ncbi:UNVERIFIED_CONTAM: hypothetical protein HDU68_002502 [Siphonaria sp. JEL0065]|nr:hypothetical protein HDU68_002502 [Siphonaria sp. JEL0065]